MSTQHPCRGLFSHSLQSMATVSVGKNEIVKRCNTCGYIEKLPRAKSAVIFVDSSLLATKQWAADDNRKETLQPITVDGAINDDFTRAYGYNPFDDRFKDQTPRFQGGTKK